jgi:hypothetical protein
MKQESCQSVKSINETQQHYIPLLHLIDSSLLQLHVAKNLAPTLEILSETAAIYCISTLNEVIIIYALRTIRLILKTFFHNGNYKLFFTTE